MAINWFTVVMYGRLNETQRIMGNRQGMELQWNLVVANFRDCMIL